MSKQDDALHEMAREKIEELRAEKESLQGNMDEWKNAYAELEAINAELVEALDNIMNALTKSSFIMLESSLADPALAALKRAKGE